MIKIDLTNMSVEEAANVDISGLNVFASSDNALNLNGVSAIKENETSDDSVKTTTVEEAENELETKIEEFNKLGGEEIIVNSGNKPKILLNNFDTSDDAWVAETLHDVESRLLKEEDPEMISMLKRIVEVIVYLKDVKKADAFNREKAIKRENKKRENLYNFVILVGAIALMFVMFGGDIKGIDNSTTKNTTISIGNTNNVKTNTIVGDGNAITGKN